VNFLQEKNTTSSHPGSSESSKAPSNSQVTYGQSSTPSSDDSTHHPSSSNSNATFSHEPMPSPARNAPILPHSAFSYDYSILSPFISIFVDEPFPFIRFQVPPSIFPCINLPTYSGPPFVRIQTHPSFDRLFTIQAHIRKIVRRPLSTLPDISDKTFPLHPFYVFSICISPCNHTDHSLHNNIGTPTSNRIPRPPVPSSSSRRHATSPPPQVRSLPSPPPTPSRPQRLRRIDKRLPLRTSTPPQPRASKTLPPPPYHLRPPTYYSRTPTPASTRPPSINNDATSPTVATQTSASTPLEYLRHVLQRVRNSLRRRGRQRHELLVLNSSFSLTLPHHAASKLLNRCRHVLVDLDDGCRFLDNDYVVSSTRDSNNSHITKTSPHHQRIVRGMPPNQLTQVTIGFPHHRNSDAHFLATFFFHSLKWNTTFMLSYYSPLCHLCPLCPTLCLYASPGM
jgi:hypothetical protein